MLGGDLVTYGEGSNYDNMLSLCSQLNEIAPVCGVLGNHEDELYFLDGDQALVEKFTAAGVTILRNEEARYTVHDNVISILGVEGSPEDFYNYGAKHLYGQRGAADGLRPAHLSGARAHLLS